MTVLDRKTTDVSFRDFSRIPTSKVFKGLAADKKAEIWTRVRFHLYDRLENVRFLGSLPDAPRDRDAFAGRHRETLLKEFQNDVEWARAENLSDIAEAIVKLQQLTAKSQLAGLDGRIALRAQFLGITKQLEEDIRDRNETVLDLHRSMRR